MTKICISTMNSSTSVKNLTFKGAGTRHTAEQAVRDLISWVNHEALFPFVPGTIRSAGGAPVLKIESLTLATETERRIASQLLTLLSSGRFGNVDELVNARGIRSRLFSSVADPEISGVAIPVANTAMDVVFAVILLARLTSTLQGDALSNRVSQCARCERFYLKRTRRKVSRFCSRACIIVASAKRSANTQNSR